MLKTLRAIGQSLRERKDYETLVKLERTNIDDVREMERKHALGRAQQVLGGNRR